MNLLSSALELFFQKMLIGIAIFNADLTLRTANPMWIDYVEKYFSQASAVFQAGMPLFELLPSSEGQLQPFIEQVLSGHTAEMKAIAFQQNGQTFYWSIELIPATEQGMVAGFLFIINDVTERKRAEQELLNAQNALFTLMSNLPGMAYRGQHNRARIMELVNASARELTGYAPEVFTAAGNLHYGELIHHEDRKQVWEALETAVQNKQPFEIVYRIYTHDHTIKWVLERGGPILSPDNKIIALEGFILDITERVLSQQLLERRVIDRTHKLSTMYEVMSVAAEPMDLQKIFTAVLPHVLNAVHAQTGVILILNEDKTALDIVADSALPAPFFKAWHQRPLHEEGLGQIILNQQTYTTNQLYLKLSKTELPLDEWPTFAGFPIMAYQQPVGVMAVLRRQERPFSEADLALLDSVADQLGSTVENDALRQENNRLLVIEERNRLARELHDAVTHSLYSLTLFAETTQRFAQMGDLDKVQHYSLRMQESAQQSLREMRLLLHNLRPPTLEKLGLVGAIQHRLDAVEKRSGINYQLKAAALGQLPASVEETLWHVAEEALNNALKHAACSLITVEIGRTDELVRLTVYDNGCGFNPQATESGGQGLSNMRERLELLGGSFTIVPAAAVEGTRITAELNLGRLPSHLTTKSWRTTL